MLRPTKEKRRTGGRGELAFLAGVFIMAGRITTFMPSAAIGRLGSIGGSMTKVPVNSA